MRDNNQFSTTAMIRSLNEKDNIKGGFFSNGLIGSQKEFVKKYIAVNQINKYLSYSMLTIGLMGVVTTTVLIWQNKISLFYLLVLPVVYGICEPLIFRSNLKRIDGTKEFQIAYINYHLKQYFGQKWENMEILCDYLNKDKINVEYDGKPMLDRIDFFNKYFCTDKSRSFLSVLTSLVDHTVGIIGKRNKLHIATLDEIFPSDFNFYAYQHSLEKCYQLREKIMNFDERWIKKFDEQFPLITRPDEALGKFTNIDDVKTNILEANRKYQQMQPVISKLGETYGDSQAVSIISLEDEGMAEQYTRKRDEDLSVDRLWDHPDPLSEVDRYYRHAPEVLKMRHLRG